MKSFAGAPIETSPWSQAVRRQVEVAAKASAPLLLIGPAGSGKSHLAELLHHSGPRHDSPLISIDCARLPGTLFFGEAFGHGSGGLVRGVGAAMGALRAALGGTVVIDNVDQLTAGARQALLRAMRERLVTPLGTAAQIPFAARIIATTRIDLFAEAAAGGFEPSLAGLLSGESGDPVLQNRGRQNAQSSDAAVHASAFLESGIQQPTVPDIGQIRIAGLSERAVDIEALVDHFVHELGGAGGGMVLSPAALEWLRNYDWPENVAELKRLVAHLVESGHSRIGRVAVERILAPDLSPWTVDHRMVEQTRFPGLGVHRLSQRATCSAAGSSGSSCRKR